MSKSRSFGLWRRVVLWWATLSPSLGWTHPSTTLHNVSTQKTLTWIFTAVKLQISQCRSWFSDEPKNWIALFSIVVFRVRCSGSSSSSSSTASHVLGGKKPDWTKLKRLSVGLSIFCSSSCEEILSMGHSFPKENPT